MSLSGAEPGKHSRSRDIPERGGNRARDDTSGSTVLQLNPCAYGLAMTGTKVLKVQTASFGEIEVPQDKILRFREGIPGFPEIHRFAVFHFKDLEPFEYLQALDDPPIALLVVNPFLLYPAYAFSVEDTHLSELQASSPADVAVYVVATVPGNPVEATINLMAPILVNEKKRLGMQVILLDSAYSISHPLFGPDVQVSEGPA